MIILPRLALPAGLFLVPAPAFAHVGHLGELAGHSHWVGVAAVAGAAAVAGLVALRGRKRRSDQDAAPKDQPDAPAETAQ